MLQKNHHFLFAQIYFGSFEDLEENWTNAEENEIDLNDPWILVLGANETNHFQQKIGLFINWSDHLG